MKLRSLALALTVGLMVGIGPMAAQDATPDAKAESMGSASTGSLLDLLRYVPNEAAYRQYLAYGDKVAWLKSWDVPNVPSVDALNKLDDQPRRRWMMIMPTQTLVPTVLGLQYVMTGDDMKYYGFDFFAADRYLEAGQPPDMISVVDGQFNDANIDTSLEKIGYTTRALEPDGTLYSLGNDYQIQMTADLPNIGKLGARNRIALIGQRMVITRATPIMQNALAAAAGSNSLADAPEYQAAVAALDDPQLADTGPLLGALFMADQVAADPVAMVGSRLSAEQIQKLKDALDLQPKLTPYVLSVFASRHNAGKTYLVMALVFSANSDAETAARNLGERIQQYTSVVTQRPFLDSIHAHFDRAFAVQANGLPVALIVLSADDPGPDSTVVPDWTRAVFARDLGFLYVNP